MRDWLKRYILPITGVLAVVVVFELLSEAHTALFFAVGFFIMFLSTLINYFWPRVLIVILGLFFLILSLIMTKSFWLLLAAIGMVAWLFKTDQVNDIFFFTEALVHPFARQSYEGIKLVEPQSNQATLLKRRSMFDTSLKSEVYEWDDINLVYFGGNTIIDLGNTFFPTGESIVIVRKLWGRTRIIVPIDLGLKLNISMISGNLSFENEHYQLTGENLRWSTPNYPRNPRRIRIVLSIAFGEVEVIML